MSVTAHANKLLITYILYIICSFSNFFTSIPNTFSTRFVLAINTKVYLITFAPNDMQYVIVCI